ncbi:MAG TPA: hypothetical protein DER67_08540 [Novosphingobium sp.]|nr:hypothetical protein [Novosphingobium sp.]
MRALRSNDAPQRSAQAAVGEVLGAWRDSGQGLQVERELRLFSGGAAIEDLPFLSTLFCQNESAPIHFVEHLLLPLLGRLKADPLTQSPLRFSTDDIQTTLVIAKFRNTTLTLQSVSGAALDRKPYPNSASFSPTETYDRILAGTARVLKVAVEQQLPNGALLSCNESVIEQGQVRHRYGRSEAQLLRSVQGSLVTLKLQRPTADHDVTREYALDGGRLLRQAAGTPHDSRLELAAALLGRMARLDAAPLLSVMAEEEGNPSLRWQALRECLGLDTARGFRTLCSLASRADDPLAVPAGALRAQLLETYPELSGVSECPA